MSTLVVKLVSAEPLPSQAGMRGRPREHGRASITGIAGMKPALVQRALAESLGCRSSALVPYARETQPGERLTFVVPGLDRNTRQLFTAEMVETPSAVVEEASEPAATEEIASEGDSVNPFEAAV